jgi:hypothetical protein
MPAELVPEKYKNMYLSREQNKNAPILNIDSIRLFGRESTQSFRIIRCGEVRI